MSSVPKPPTGGERPPLSSFRPDDPIALRAWLADLRAHVLDAVAAGEDATRKPSARVLSRAESRRKLQEAERALLRMIEAAESSTPQRHDAR